MSAIFIGHSSEDNAEADAMAAWLKKQSHTSYFVDYDEKSGREQVLHERLRQCQAIAALVPDWLESKWCFAEMIHAGERGQADFPAQKQATGDPKGVRPGSLK